MQSSSSRIQERTYSLWSYLWKQRLDYMNPLYRADHSQTQGTLRPHTTPCHFRFWRGLYNRFEKGMHPRQSVTDFLQAVKEETQQLEEEMEFMEKRLTKLETRESNETYKNLNDQPKIHNFQICITKHSPANTPQDYSTNLKLFPSRSPSQGEEDSALILTQDHLKSSDPDLSANIHASSFSCDHTCPQLQPGTQYPEAEDLTIELQPPMVNIGGFS
ncbi:phosphatidylinositol-3-phosphate phosphatase MTMR7-like [Phyllobates terribilis]|uniref:phosphatidylinositol-3-phosphate phosphatase MTMR7-like n=1 Tax=Phyllobates terribilis TaxID=111132 RepID=UPI003CCB3430